MNIALMVCPAWARETPHLALAILSANVRHAGHGVSVFDLNNLFFHACEQRFKECWLKHRDFSWTQHDFIGEFIACHAELIDRAVRQILETNAPLIGFSVYFPTELMSLALARRIKAADKGRVIVFGGPQCLAENNGRTLIQDEAVDMVVQGEGDVTLLEVLKLLEAGRPIENCPGIMLKTKDGSINYGLREPHMDLDSLPFPDFSGADLNSYERPSALPALFSRGCVQQCVYCLVNNCWKAYRSAGGMRMFNEIKRQVQQFPSVTEIDFYDPVINGNTKALRMLCEALIDSVKRGEMNPIHWRGEGIIRPEMTPELLLLMKQAGCRQLTYGIESGSQRILQKMNKRHTVQCARQVLRDTRQAGISVTANFMFGFPTETRDDFRMTLDFLRENHASIDEVNPSESFCFIYKDTYLYTHAEEFGLDPGPDTRFWESRDKENTFPERMRRFEEFCELALSLHLKVGSGLDRVRLNKETDMKMYAEHLKRMRGVKAHGGIESDCAGR